MPVCAACGEANPPRARFCQRCGSGLATLEGLPDERKLVTVLFADLAGSTGLGERLDPEHLGSSGLRRHTKMIPPAPFARPCA